MLSWLEKCMVITAICQWMFPGVAGGINGWPKHWDLCEWTNGTFDLLWYALPKMHNRCNPLASSDHAAVPRASSRARAHAWIHLRRHQTTVIRNASESYSRLVRNTSEFLSLENGICRWFHGLRRELYPTRNKHRSGKIPAPERMVDFYPSVHLCMSKTGPQPSEYFELQALWCPGIPRLSLFLDPGSSCW